ncbi:MAG: DoxX family protein [Alphaproteobacteria bacterium]
MTFLTPYAPRLLSVMRIMSGLLLLQHGTTKVLDFPASPMSAVPLTTPGGIAGIIELIFGVLLTVGLFSRFSAFILSGLTAVAYFMVHAPRDFFPLLNGGELAALYCFVFLYLAAAGPGPWALDVMLNSRKTARSA